MEAAGVAIRPNVARVTPFGSALASSRLPPRGGAALSVLSTCRSSRCGPKSDP
jgi:hypothetical protein